MELDLLKRLDDEISQQTRNGRTDVYIRVEDLNELGYGIDPNKKGKVYVDVGYLKIMINNYKKEHKKELFKENLKVQPDKSITFKQLEQEIKDIEMTDIKGIRDEI